jgi:ribonuclease HI
MPKVVTVKTGIHLHNDRSGDWRVSVIPPTGPAAIYTGSDVETTNTRLDLLAVVAGLRILHEPSQLRVYMSSEYARLAAEWCKKPLESSSRNMRGLPNEQLLLELRTLAHRHSIAWHLGTAQVGVSIGDGFAENEEQKQHDENESALQAL